VDKYGVHAGLIVRGVKGVSRAVESGFNFIILGTDTKLLKKAICDSTFKKFSISGVIFSPQR